MNAIDLRFLSCNRRHTRGGALALLLLTATGVRAENVWTGDGGNTDWFNDANWSEGVPDADQAVTVGAGTIELTNATPELASFTMTGGTLTFANWSTCLRAGTVSLAAGTVTLPSAFTESQMSNRVWIACTDFVLGTNAVIDADFRGYSAAQGPGKAGHNNSGAGHGGRGSPGYQGWNMAGTAYDDVLAPAIPGSGGGGVAGGGAGGGAVWIQAAGKVKIFGTVGADGQAGVVIHNGGGSGGSIRIDCGTFHGSSSGWLRARGGNGNNLGGPGSGGRIAVVYNPAAQAALAAPNPGVKFSAGYGLSGYNATYAQPGTLYLPGMETLFLSSTLSKQWDSLAAHIPGFETWNLDRLVVAGQIDLPSLRELTVTNTVSIAAGGALALYSGATNGIAPAPGLLVDIGGALAVTGSLYLACEPTNGAAPRVTAASLSVGPKGTINADGRGYLMETGPGAAAPYGGGGHGGAGSAGNAAWSTAGAVNDDPLSPTAPGSGGGSLLLGGYGGGVIDLDVTGDAAVYGTLSASGMNAPGTHGGGGAGGSILLRCRRLLGDARGAVRANGGNGVSLGGPGGGGRIAILYDPTEQAAVGNPGIKFGAAAGTSGEWASLAEAGTLYLPDIDTLFLSETLTTQWEGLNVWAPAFTSWSVGSLTVAGKIAFPHLNELNVAGDLTIGAGGLLALHSGAALIMQPDVGMHAAIGGALTIEGTLELRADRATGTSPFLQCREMTLANGGKVLADYQGFNYAAGPGGGTVRGGGGHGGAGGGVDGGQTNGMRQAPVFAGSGGGNSDDGGGRGGGAVRIAARGTMRLDGTVSANAMGSKKVHGGGGAGGAILLLARGYEGSGAVLSANGGKGLTYGCGGGGGRIALLSPCLSPADVHALATRNKTGNLRELTADAWPELAATLSVSPGTSGYGVAGSPGTLFYGHFSAGTLFMVR